MRAQGCGCWAFELQVPPPVGGLRPQPLVQVNFPLFQSSVPPHPQTPPLPPPPPSTWLHRWIRVYLLLDSFRLLSSSSCPQGPASCSYLVASSWMVYTLTPLALGSCIRGHANDEFLCGHLPSWYRNPLL